MRVVLDTASFVTAVRSSGASAGVVLQMLLRSKVIVLMDLKLGLEYRDVAARELHLTASGLSEAEVLSLVEVLESVAEPVDVLIGNRPLSSDPNDDMVLDIAINGRADALITGNTKHFEAAAARFGISVFTPSEFLRYLKR